MHRRNIAHRPSLYIPRQTLDGRRLGQATNLTFRAGHPTALFGASGAGKTTLLKQIAGWIGADNSGQFIGDGIVMLSAYRRAASHLCLHDAAILSDTIRENLFAPDASETECWQALAAVGLDARFADAGGLEGLSDAPLVLLDEPVEHLDS